MGKNYTKEVNYWYDKFSLTRNVSERISVIKDICGLQKPKQFYEELDIGNMIIDISSDFEKEGIEETYVEFLEWLKRVYPGIFEFGFPWHCRNLLYHYIAEGKRQKVADIIIPFFQTPERDLDVFADILDVLRVNGFPALTGKLVRTAYPKIKAKSDILSWALAELSQLCGVSIISEHITIGGGIQSKAIGKLKDDLSEFDCEWETEFIVEIITRLSGKRDTRNRWTASDFICKDRFAKNLNLLFLDFVRYLNRDKNIDLICADAFRDLVYRYLIHEINAGNKPFYQLRRQQADEYIAGLCGFISLMQTRAFALLCGLKLFYDFLQTEGMFDAKEHTRIMNDIAHLKEGLCTAFKQGLWKYQFIEKWL